MGRLIILPFFGNLADVRWGQNLLYFLHVHPFQFSSVFLACVISFDTMRKKSQKSCIFKEKMLKIALYGVAVFSGYSQPIKSPIW